jgi:hypothetical protein
LVALESSPNAACSDPTMSDLERLCAWLLASGEYDDEVARLEGWVAFLRCLSPERGHDRLRAIVAFAVAFEAEAERVLGPYTRGVSGFLREKLPARPAREDSVQCSRPSSEYHLNMLGAELLNRAWRSAFLACRRHVVVLPGCARCRSDSNCRALRGANELWCAHCTSGCAVSAATRVAEKNGAEALAVTHGSDFSRFLRSEVLRGHDVGIVGVACVPGLIGAGLRAHATGLPAQCVLLDASGCAHWRQAPVPTSLDLAELGRILDRGNQVPLVASTARVA